MGVYDILPGGQQVKCWNNEMEDIFFGDIVPRVNGEITYSIALREGGYANVTNCEFISITRKSLHSLVFDKWGNLIDSIDELQTDYLFRGKLTWLVNLWDNFWFSIVNKCPLSIPIIWADPEALRIHRAGCGVNIFWEDVFHSKRRKILWRSINSALRLIFLNRW